MFSTASMTTRPGSRDDMHSFNDTGVYSMSVSLSDTKPNGQVLKLEIPNVEQADEPAFGTHIREAIEIVRDWSKSR